MELPAIFLGKPADATDAGKAKLAGHEAGEQGSGLFGSLLSLQSDSVANAPGDGTLSVLEPGDAFVQPPATSTLNAFTTDAASPGASATGFHAPETLDGPLLDDPPEGEAVESLLPALSNTSAVAATTIEGGGAPALSDHNSLSITRPDGIPSAEIANAGQDAGAGAAANYGAQDSKSGSATLPVPSTPRSPAISDSKSPAHPFQSDRNFGPESQSRGPFGEAANDRLMGEDAIHPGERLARVARTGPPARPPAAALVASNIELPQPQDAAKPVAEIIAAAHLAADGKTPSQRATPTGTGFNAAVSDQKPDGTLNNDNLKSNDGSARAETDRAASLRLNANALEIGRPGSAASTPTGTLKTIISPIGTALTYSLPDREDGQTALTGLGDRSMQSSILIRVGTVNGPGTALQLPINAIAAHITSQATRGNQRFDIRLDPPELGRVDVRLEISKDGAVTTHLVVEKAETLDLLQRDARALERALQDAGLKTSDDGLSFSLKDQSLADHFAEEQEAHSNANGDEGAADDISEGLSAEETHQGAYVLARGLDIRI